MKRAKKLKTHLLIPIAAVFLLLWAGMVLGLHQLRLAEVRQEIAAAELNAAQQLGEQWDYYRSNAGRGLGPEAEQILQVNVSAIGSSLLWNMNGGAAIELRLDGGRSIKNQLAWGYGHEAGVDQGQRWTLELDSGLDDAGQLAFAKWLTRSGWRGWCLWPEESQGAGDGTVARVKGEALPGYCIRVERIELLHPDGRVETVVETSHHGAAPRIWEFRYLSLNTALAVSYDTEEEALCRRLACYRAAEEQLRSEKADFAFHPFDSADPALEGNGYLIAAAADEGRTVWARNWRIDAGGLLLVLLAAFALAAILSYSVSAPVTRLCEEAKRGHCGEEGRIRELNELAASFNEAQGRVKAQLLREREFTRAAAHELKTPLAVLRSHAEALQEDILPEKREQYLNVLMEEADRMAGLTGQLLELSRLDQEGTGKREAVDLKALTEEAFAPLRLAFARKKMRLALELSEATVCGDREQLKAIPENLASNALRYGAEGGSVRVLLQNEGTELRLAVENDGPPLPEEALSRIFEPFYRVDKARSRESGGTGLGLALLKAAAERHGGSCGVENTEGGVRFFVLLPRA